MSAPNRAATILASPWELDEGWKRGAGRSGRRMDMRFVGRARTGVRKSSGAAQAFCGFRKEPERSGNRVVVVGDVRGAVAAVAAVAVRAVAVAAVAAVAVAAVAAVAVAAVAVAAVRVAAVAAVAVVGAAVRAVVAAAVGGIGFIIGIGVTSWFALRLLMAYVYIC